LAKISTYLQKILSAIYGEEVRGSIHDALSAMNEESSSAMEYAHTAKDSAAASASAAKTSESAAAQNAAAAEAAKTSAKVSEENAIQSASEAVKAATNAANAANTIAQKVTDAEAFANAAKTAETNAAASAVSAMQYSGKPPKPQNGTWWIWDAEKGNYVDSKISCELVGPAGVGVKDIQLTSGNHAPGSTDIYTLTLTDGTTTSISVYNGRNGTGAGNVLGVYFDLVLPASEWSNKEITITDERLLALESCKYFLSADEASQEEYRKYNVRPKDITTNGCITFESDANPTKDLTVNLVRLEMGVNMTG